MTDLQKFKDLYASLGIELEIASYKDEISLSLEDGNQPAITGCPGLYTTIDFTKEGKFLRQGFYE